MRDVSISVISIKLLLMLPTKQGQPKVHIKVWKSADIGVPIKSLLLLSGMT